MQPIAVRGYKKVLAVLASAAFVVGTAELVVVGILSLIAQDLHVSISNAVLWGFVGFGLIPSYQLQVLSLAKEGARLASTLGVSAVNAGVAIGALICLVALPLTLYTKRLWHQY